MERRSGAWTHGRRFGAEFGGGGRKKLSPKILMTLLLVIDRFLSVFCLSLLSELGYMTLFLTRNVYFTKKIPPSHLFLVNSYFATLPIILLLKILGGRMHGLSHPP